MCGIAGFINLDGEQARPEIARSMIATIRHRGPDASGVVCEGPAAIAHARLSIIDVAGGAQPMSNEARTAWLTFNGEIFNHTELRERLERDGERFATRSDTEVLLRMIERHGADALDQLNGQWAFAFWDVRARSLLLARDRIGVRPLYYTRTAHAFVFASEVKALFAHPEVARRIDPRALDQIFTMWSTVSPRTFFEGVEELRPGHALELGARGTRITRHWHLGFEPSADGRDETRATSALRDALIDATRLRMLRSDVPVVAYLSGGLDSTITAAIVRKYTDVPLKTFSVAFDDRDYDESAYQRLVAERLGTEHHALRCRAEDIGRVFPDVIWHTEQPVVRTAPAPLYLLARLVREHGYKVALTGEGSDEMLGGYDLFKENKVRRFCAAHPESTKRPLLFRKLYPYLPGLHAAPEVQAAFFHRDGASLDDPFYSHRPRWDLTASIKRLFSPALRGALADAPAPETALRDQLPADFASWPPFCQAQYLEAACLLPGYILSSQGDRMAMAHGVEGRFPFLDPRVLAVASGLAPRWKMRGLDEKYILKQAFSDLVPEAVLRRPKQPYRAPEAASFFDTTTGRARFEYVDALLSERAIAKHGLFNSAAVAALVTKARAGAARSARDGMALVGILSAQLVAEQFIERVGSVRP